MWPACSPPISVVGLLSSAAVSREERLLAREGASVVTRPSALRPREGEQPGTPFERFSAGVALTPMQFTLDPEVIAEYTSLLGADLSWYQNCKGTAGWRAPATSPALYLLALLYRTFPPVQG